MTKERIPSNGCVFLFAWSETMRNQGCSADQTSFFLGRFVTAQRFLGELFAADPRDTRTSRFRPMLRVDKPVLEPNEYVRPLQAVIGRARSTIQRTRTAAPARC
ncbi:hypothetical protein [Xanthomonas oryzae]|uniref:Uncharacterized protein n=1 Tax=Xanthomonas oryzae pv. leersiae TaxID=3112258 RepID=A0AAJ6KLZ9_9XANT|nr:hypothetical protein [Xanthomonas oryzae]UNE64104.1 hypothetical protein MML47_08240 [Xanthomonas oryzae]WIX05463.1 hypothetical protein QN060_14605 [Xanthomonas oryzae pv. oryzae]